MEKLIINQADKNVQELAQKDPIMGKLISIIGNIDVHMRTDYFSSLVRSIIGQQISVAAASAVYNRLDILLEHDIKADAFQQITDEQLRAVGLSGRKVIYIRDLADNVNQGNLEMQKLHELDNETIIQQLTSVKGIGKWTAEMFLILSLGRMDVLAIDDIGIQRGAKWLYQVDKTERRNTLKEKSDVWHPHLTIASCYLWEVVHLDFERRFTSIDAI